jgi:hypothetical protein
MKFELQSPSASRPDWTYSVQAPRILSPLWVLERLATLSIPIAVFVLIAAAKNLDLISFQ